MEPGQVERAWLKEMAVALEECAHAQAVFGKSSREFMDAAHALGRLRVLKPR